MDGGLYAPFEQWTFDLKDIRVLVHIPLITPLVLQHLQLCNKLLEVSEKSNVLSGCCHFS